MGRRPYSRRREVQRRYRRPDLATGKVRWNYQFTHHDLWDMDVGSQPTLVHLKTDDGMKPAVIVPTKQGSLYVLDRRDGTPIVPIREIPVPKAPSKAITPHRPRHVRTSTCSAPS